MKKAPFATVISALSTECPYCGKDVLIEGSDMQDMTGWDFEEEGTEDCPHCEKEFEYSIGESENSDEEG